MSKDCNGHGRNGPRCVTLPTLRPPSVVVTFWPAEKQWPAVVRKRCPVGFWTTKPEEQTKLPSEIELPPQKPGTSLRRSNVSRTASFCWSIRPAYCCLSGAVTDAGAVVLSTTLPVLR